MSLLEYSRRIAGVPSVLHASKTRYCNPGTFCDKTLSIVRRMKLAWLNDGVITVSDAAVASLREGTTKL